MALSKKLDKYIKSCLKQGQLLDARIAADKAGVEIPKDELIKYGTIYFKKGLMHIAVTAFRIANKKIPKALLIECATVCTKQGRSADAEVLLSEAALLDK